MLQTLNHRVMPGSAASPGVASTATHRGERVDDEKNDEDNEATDQATDQEQPNKRRRVHILDDAENSGLLDAHTFSFLSDTDNIVNQRGLLDGADIFWFAGVHHVSALFKEFLTPRRDETNANDLAA